MWKLDIFYKRYFGIPDIFQKILRIMVLEHRGSSGAKQGTERQGNQHHFSKDEKKGKEGRFPSSVSKVENEDFHMENFISTF